MLVYEFKACDAFKCFFNWIERGLNLKSNTPIIFTTKVTNYNTIYVTPSLEISVEDFKTVATWTHFLHVFDPDMKFIFHFPSTNKYFFNLKSVARSLFMSGHKMNISEIEDQQERFNFITLFLYYVDHMLTELPYSFRPIEVLDVTKVHPIKLLTKPNDVSIIRVSNDINHMILNERPYSIVYAFVKAIQHTSMMGNWKEAFSMWTSTSTNWSAYCKKHNIGYTLDIFHKDHILVSQNKIVINLSDWDFIHNKSNDEIQKYTDRLIEIIESTYGISVKGYEHLINDIKSCCFNEDDYLDFIDLNPDCNIPIMPHTISLFPCKNPMVYFNDIIDTIRNGESAEKRLKRFRENITVETYEQVISMFAFDAKQSEEIANLINDNIGKFPFVDVYGFWMNVHNFHADRAGIERRIKINYY